MRSLALWIIAELLSFVVESHDARNGGRPAGLGHPRIGGPWMSRARHGHNGGVERAELADFLRRRRERLSPGEVGLSGGRRRRTPGLRREEVAQLAGVSTDYVARLEQSRGPQPSAQVLAALARALRLTDDERDHLYHLAGRTPPASHRPSTHVSPVLLHVLDHLTDSAAMVISDLGETLVQNPVAVALHGDDSRHRGLDRFMLWRWFTDPATRARCPEEDWAIHSRTHVADLRATAARRQGDPDVLELVEQLTAASDEFTELWAQHEVAVRRANHKRIIHPEVGMLDLLCDVLVGSNGDQFLVVLFPRPGTDTREKLDLLRVIGTQNLTSSTPGR
jgi:transcriptional regulator with XRE-family HTH domain